MRLRGSNWEKLQCRQCTVELLINLVTVATCTAKSNKIFEMKIYVGVEKIEYEMSHLEIDGPVAMPGK